MRYGTPADEERLLNDIRERAKNPARLDPRAAKIADGTITAERACRGKVPYRTPEFALAQVKAIGERFGTPMTMYHCDFCDCFHLATKRTA